MREFMPILNAADKIADLRAAGQTRLVIAIPWASIAPHERQAQANHYQTLERLAQRGGLAACEALAVLQGRPWRAVPAAEANAALLALLPD